MGKEEIILKKRREYQKAYSKTDKGKIWKKEQNRRRRLYTTAIVHQFTVIQWDNKLKRSKGICKQCKTYVSTVFLTLDHRFPISKAYKRFLRTGEKTIYTIRKVDAICHKCNSSKRNK